MRLARAWWAYCPPYILLAAALLLAPPAWAVQPHEMLDDPVLEERARELSKGLRCLVCRNESIDDSNADLAADMRVLVRERLVAGDSDAEVIAFLVDRFGEYVLLNPVASGSNWVLWAAGPAMLLLGLGIGLGYLRRREQAEPAHEAALLSDEDKKRLEDILRD